MDVIIAIIAIPIIIILLIAARKLPVTILDRSQTFFDGLDLPAQAFYAAVKAGLAERQIIKVAISEKAFLERHIASAKRVYLRVAQDEYVFYLCAAPYGTGTFISSWLCVRDEQFVNKIPLVSKLAGKARNNKTFYQMDTEAMFRLAVRTVVAEVVDNLSEAQGFRGLSELEKLRAKL